MGFDVDRFINNIDEELRCQICFGVLEDPLQAIDCEHTFCRICINEWLKNSNTCPVDRNILKNTELQQIPRIVRNILNHLILKCDFEKIGCEKTVMLEELESHKSNCKFNPELPIDCPKNCGALVPKNRLTEHDCVKELRELLAKQQAQISQLIANVHELTKFKLDQQELSYKNSNFLEKLTERYNQLENSVSNLELPIQEILSFTKGQNQKNEINENEDKQNLTTIQNKLARETTIEIFIKNLSRQITMNILIDYLNKNDIHVIDCIEGGLSNGFFNNFIVTVLKSASQKILVPNLWPINCEVFICSDYYSSKIDGNKTSLNDFDLINS